MADMTYRPRRKCVICGISRSGEVHLSRTGKCATCGEFTAIDAIVQMRARNGIVYDKYKDRIAEYVLRLWGEEGGGRTPPDFPVYGQTAESQSAILARVRAGDRA